MAYALQAFIGDFERLAAHAPPKGVVVALAQGKGMIPFTNEFRKEHGFRSRPMMDGEPALPEAIAFMGKNLSSGGCVAYVEAEFFGGDGTQAAMIWENGNSRGEPFVEQHAINAALRALGVSVGGAFDEFDAIGLGRHREED